MSRFTRLMIVLCGAAVLLGGCADSSMSDTVKPNPAMANRYKQGGGTQNPTGPAGQQGQQAPTGGGTTA